MTLFTDLYPKTHLLSRTFYNVPGISTIVVPSGATITRISLGGAGGWSATPQSGYGSGAAFARRKTACSGGESFSVQVGDFAYTRDAGSALGDSIVTRVTGSVVLAKAERGHLTTPGLAANSVGDVTRDGTARTAGDTAWSSAEAASYSGFSITPTAPGMSAGDDADTFPLGFGGRGAGIHITAANGGGGGFQLALNYQSGFLITDNFFPGMGRVCLEFFDQDPGY